MKRTFSTSEHLLPSSMHEVCSVIDSLSEVEDSIVDKFNAHQRRTYAKPNTTAPSVTQKIYRVYLRHKFMSATSEENAHFLIRLEGCILDPRYECIPGSSFCEIFDKVKIQPDKRFYAQQARLEWESEENFHSSCRNSDVNLGSQGKGTNNHCSPRAVEFKLYGDKQSVAKIALHQNSKFCARYEVSSKLREIILPGIKRDPTLEEVILAVINYAQRKFLVKSRKNLIELDENLKEIFGDIGQIATSQIGDRLIEYELLKPFRKIYHVDIPLNLEASLVFPKDENVYNNNSMSQIGGRVFDIEIDLIDEFGFESQFYLNTAAAVYGDAEKYFSRLFNGAQFVSSNIKRTQKELDILLQLVRNTLYTFNDRNFDLFYYKKVMETKFGPNFILSQSVINAGVRDLEKAVGRRKGYFCPHNQFYDCNSKRSDKIDQRNIVEIKCDEIQRIEEDFIQDVTFDVKFTSSSKPGIPEKPQMKIPKWISTCKTPKNREQGSVATSNFDYHGHVHAYQAFLDVGNDEIFTVL